MELAATRLIRESTASRVHDILLVVVKMRYKEFTIKHKHDNFEGTLHTKFCCRAKMPGQFEPRSCLAKKEHDKFLATQKIQDTEQSRRVQTKKGDSCGAPE